jgi:rfaE bifunctional protein nucleotidyltransferase chain/domain
MITKKIAASVAEAAAIAQAQKAAGKKVVLCHGVFDLLHPGHIMHIEAARQFGDFLVITVTPDRFVNKGPGRPAFNERLRARTLAAIEAVDLVGVNEWPSAVETIAAVKPDFYVKGQDYEDSSKDLSGKISAEEAAVREAGGEIRFTREVAFSSSELINRAFSPHPPSTQKWLEELRRKFKPEYVIDLLKTYGPVKPLVVGEVILDEYCYATPLAKAPREAIIAAKYQSTEVFAGGAAATANHIAGFCDQVTLVATVGPDPEHLELVRSKLRPNITLVPIITPDRTTVRKRRFLEPGHLTKLFEIQYLDDSDIKKETETQAGKALEQLMPRHDMMVVNDFGHGFLTEGLRQLITGRKTFVALNTQTNSANLGFNLITKYPSADYCCIDQAEAQLASGIHNGSAAACAQKLISRTGAKWFMTTTGRSGATLTLNDGRVLDSPAVSPSVLDRVGAGDAFFAITSPWAFKEYEPELVGLVGNCVGALKVLTVGNRTPIDPVQLYKFITSILR